MSTSGRASSQPPRTARVDLLQTIPTCRASSNRFHRFIQLRERAPMVIISKTTEEEEEEDEEDAIEEERRGAACMQQRKPKRTGASANDDVSINYWTWL